MAETEIGTAYKRNIEADRRKVSFTVGVTTYTGFTVGDITYEPTSEEIVHRDHSGDTDQRVFYDAGKQVSLNVTVKDSSGYLDAIPKGTAVTLSSTSDTNSEVYILLSHSTVQTKGENARMSMSLIREDSMGSAYDAL